MRRPIVLLAASLLLGCGTAKPGGMSGPTMNNRMVNDEPPPPELQSNDILDREQRTYKADVKHILIGWKGHGDASRQDERAKKRTRAEADALVEQLFAQLENGAPIEALMQQYSEDPGSINGNSYEVEPGGQLVLEFRRLSLRLDVGEVGIVLSDFGWHIIKRIE
jgi:hypothetical protein